MSLNLVLIRSKGRPVVLRSPDGSKFTATNFQNRKSVELLAEKTPLELASCFPLASGGDRRNNAQIRAIEQETFPCRCRLLRSREREAAGSERLSQWRLRPRCNGCSCEWPTECNACDGRPSFEVGLDPIEAWHCCFAPHAGQRRVTFPAPALKIRSSNEESSSFYR